MITSSSERQLIKAYVACEAQDYPVSKDKAWQTGLYDLIMKEIMKVSYTVCIKIETVCGGDGCNRSLMFWTHAFMHSKDEAERKQKLSILLCNCGRLEHMIIRTDLDPFEP